MTCTTEEGTLIKAEKTFYHYHDPLVLCHFTFYTKPTGMKQVGAIATMSGKMIRVCSAISSVALQGGKVKFGYFPDNSQYLL